MSEDERALSNGRYCALLGVKGCSRCALNADRMSALRMLARYGTRRVLSLQRFPIPLGQISSGFVGTLQKIHQSSFG